MKEYIHKIAKTGKEFAHKLPEDHKEMVDLVGKQLAFTYESHGYRIACNAVDRNEGQEGKRAKLAKVLELARTDPDVRAKLEDAGIDVDSL